MARNSDYWKKRMEALEDMAYAESEQYYKDIQEQFRRATNAIQEDIELWYYRIEDNNNISYAAAKKLLKKNELEEFHWTVDQYIKAGEENAIDQRWMKQLENASAKVHISRLEAMKTQIQQHAEILYSRYEKGMTEFLGERYKNGYYRTAFEIMKGTSVGYDLHAIDTRKIDIVLTKPWAADGANFSDRIWKDKKRLINVLHTELSQHMIRGESVDKMIENVSKAMNVSKKQAGRLIMTETSAISSVATKESYKDLGVEQYEILATLDYKTSEICRQMDKKVFPMSDYVINVTAPPFHPFCRSTTIPYFDDEFTEDEQRAARGVDGKTYYVPADMKYEEWYDKYIGSSLETEIAAIKLKNLISDKKQYDDYVSRLGKEYLPASVDEFQDVKYGDSNEYGILKAQYRGMSYYEKALDNEPLITSGVKTVAKKKYMETCGLEYRLKSKDSYLRKIRSEYKADGNTYEVKDIIRYTLGTEEPDVLVERMRAAIDDFAEMGYNTTVVKNTWNNPRNPYKGINTTVVAPNGQKFEVQYHTKESYELKEKMHKLYEDWRVIEDKTSEKAISLNREMMQLSRSLKIPKNIEKVK